MARREISNAEMLEISMDETTGLDKTFIFDKGKIYIGEDEEEND